MDRNLEKNLRKIQGLRAKGQLEKALKQLQDWAKKHPDTPHYQYEAAAVALDLGDHATGLRWLKNLLRHAPDSRERVLEAVNERYEAEPILPLGEFLVDRYLAKSQVAEALEVIERLGDGELEVYRQKLELRSRSLSASPSEELARVGYTTQLGIARAQKRPEDFARAVDGLIEAVPSQAETLLPLCEEESKTHPRSPELAAACGLCALAAEDDTRACQYFMAAAKPATASSLLDRILDHKPQDEAKGCWLRALGELALASGDTTGAAQYFLEAADAEPTLRKDILARLEHLPPSLEPSMAAPLWKLQLRLLVVMRKYSLAPPLIERLRKEELVDPQELRTLMGEGQDGEPAEAEMSFLLADAALRAKDLHAAAIHANEIPDQDEHTLNKLIRSIEKVLPEWEDGQRLELAAMQAVLYARLGQQHGANDTLAELWEREGDPAPLFAVTESCLQRIHPSARLFSAMLQPALSHDRGDLLQATLDGLLRHNADDFKWTADDLVAHMDEHPEHASEILHLLDSVDRELGASQLLRYPVACAALACNEMQRAVPEFQILLMARPQLARDVLDRLRRALIEKPGDADLNLAAFELLLEAKEEDEAGQCLSRALRAQPERIEELSERFEKLLEDSSEHPAIWLEYGDALYSVGRYSQLDELVQRALTSSLAPNVLADLRLLQARVLIDEGHLDDAVNHLELLLQEQDSTPARTVETIQHLLGIDPGHGRAQFLLGRASAIVNDLDSAVAAFCSAAKLDRTLVNEIAQQLDVLMASPAATADHILLMADFDRRFRDVETAARGYERALRLKPEVADLVLASLATETESPRASVPLLYAAARAARSAGKLEESCRILTQIYSQNVDEFKRVTTELRLSAQEHPDELLPVHTTARILLANKETQSAAALIVSAARNENHPPETRRTMLEEFHERIPGHSGLLLELAHLHSNARDRDKTAALLWEALANEELKTERALSICERALEDAPEHGELRLLHHDLLLRQGKVELALEALPDPSALPTDRQSALSERLAAAPRRGHVRVLFTLNQAESLRQAGHRQESVAVLRKAFEKAQGEDRVRLGAELARGLEHLGRHDEALEIFKGLAGSEMEWTDIYAMVGRWKIERLERESEALRQRIEENPSDDEARLSLAALLLERDQAEEAASTLSDASCEGEHAMRRACLLADAYLRRDRTNRAEAVLMAVESRAENFWVEEIGWRLAECAARAGRHAEAFARYQLLLDNPRYGARARERASEAYGRYLSDLAGEYKAVLSKVSTL